MGGGRSLSAYCRVASAGPVPLYPLPSLAVILPALLPITAAAVSSLLLLKYRVL